MDWEIIIPDYQYPKAIEFLERSISLSQKIDYGNGLSIALNNLGLLYSNVGNADKAQQCFYRCIAIDSVAGYKAAVGMSYNNLGRLYGMKNDYAKSIYFYYKAFDIFSGINDLRQKAGLLNNIGNTYLMMGQPERAVDYYFQSVQMREKINDIRGIAINYTNIASCYINKNIDSALFYQKKALKYYEDINDKLGVVQALNSLGIIFEKKKLFAEAIIYFEKAVNISIQINDKAGLANSWYEIGNVYKNQRKYQQAISYYSKSLEISQQRSDKKTASDNLLKISETFASIGDFKMAYFQFMAYHEMYDSVNNEMVKTKIAELQTRFETDLKDNEIALLNKENKLKEMENMENREKIYKQKWYIFTFGFLLLFAALSAVLFFRLYAVKNKSNVILASQNKEINEQKLEIARQRDNLGLLNLELYKQKEIILNQRNAIEFELKETIVKSEILKRENIQFQLETLKNQINPHFLFNTFSTLISLIQENQQMASNYVLQLSNVYRYILMNKEKELTTLTNELEFINAYMYLIAIRFDNNITLKTEIEQQYFNYQMPLLSLQLLIENAVKHNIISDKKPLTISIFNEANKLIVKNNLQKKSSIENSTKIGLQNIQNRYVLLINEKIEIAETENEFKVALPLIEPSIF